MKTKGIELSDEAILEASWDAETGEVYPEDVAALNIREAQIMAASEEDLYSESI